jgi:hypothetical protein
MTRSRVLVLATAVLATTAIAVLAQAAAAPARHHRVARTEAKAPAPAHAAARADSAVRHGGQEEAPVLYLAWRAPYGLKGATDTLVPVCGDTTHVDTLWLSFEPTRDESTFIGIGGDIEIRALPGDTLGEFWQMGPGGANHGGMAMKLGLDPEFPGEQPWNRHGVGSVRWESEPTVARFRFFNVTAVGQTIPVQAGHRYTAACLTIRATHPDLAGCGRPVCLGWGRSDVAFAAGNELLRYGGGSVGWGAGGKPCKLRPQPWRPKFDLPGQGRGADTLRVH